MSDLADKIADGLFKLKNYAYIGRKEQPLTLDDFTELDARIPYVTELGVKRRTLAELRTKKGTAERAALYAYAAFGVNAIPKLIEYGRHDWNDESMAGAINILHGVGLHLKGTTHLSSDGFYYPARVSLYDIPQTLAAAVNLGLSTPMEIFARAARKISESAESSVSAALVYDRHVSTDMSDPSPLVKPAVRKSLDNARASYKKMLDWDSTCATIFNKSGLQGGFTAVRVIADAVDCHEKAAAALTQSRLLTDWTEAGHGEMAGLGRMHEALKAHPAYSKAVRYREEQNTKSAAMPTWG